MPLLFSEFVSLFWQVFTAHQHGIGYKASEDTVENVSKMKNTSRKKHVA